jgi:hypothetical protein
MYTEDYGCKYCWDNRKQQEKEPLYFFDTANNMRVCNYCPYCGRKYGEVPVNEQLDLESEPEYEYQYE